MHSMYVNVVQEAQQAQEESVATDVAQFAGRLADRSQYLAERLNGKLHSVMTSDCPRPVEVVKSQGKEYPPLFNDLRSNFQKISDSFDSIEYAIQRTEL